jgi:hypothetical protein
MKQEYSDEKYIYDQKQAAKNEGIQEGIERQKKQSELQLKVERRAKEQANQEKEQANQEKERLIEILKQAGLDYERNKS